MFIEINGQILDQEVVQRQMLLIKKVMLYECAEILKKYGFEPEKEENSFKNQDLFLNCRISFSENNTFKNPK